MPVSGTLATLRLAARAKIVRFWETVGYVGQTEVEGGGEGRVASGGGGDSSSNGGGSGGGGSDAVADSGGGGERVGVASPPSFPHEIMNERGRTRRPARRAAVFFNRTNVSANGGITMPFCERSRYLRSFLETETARKITTTYGPPCSR